MIDFIIKKYGKQIVIISFFGFTIFAVIFYLNGCVLYGFAIIFVNQIYLRNPLCFFSFLKNKSTVSSFGLKRTV